MVTGDPTIDAIITWLTSGGHLTSTVAAAAIAAIVRWLLLPLASIVMEKVGKPLGATSKVYLAYVFSVLVAIIAGLLDKTGTTMTTALAVGLAAGAMAIGIHQTGKVPAEQSKMLKVCQGKGEEKMNKNRTQSPAFRHGVK
jgi:small neutral amino acid transporter SnatA (MarC family)